MIIIIGIVAWIAVVVFTVGLCRAAKRGDQQ